MRVQLATISREHEEHSLLGNRIHIKTAYASLNILSFFYHVLREGTIEITDLHGWSPEVLQEPVKQGSVSKQILSCLESHGTAIPF